MRGAPAIGIAAAYGYALAARSGEDLDAAAGVLAASRPTAVNLAWALDEMRRWDGDPAERARQIHAEEVERCRAMSAHAATLLFPGTRALTHCNAGGLATGGYGTAVGALRAGVGARAARARARRRDTPAPPGLAADRVGARGGGHPAHGDRRLRGRPDDGHGRGRRVVTGADRIAANGDTANKIGTYSLAVLAAPPRHPALCGRAELDRRPRDAETGEGIPIEERPGEEVTDAIRCAKPGVRRHSCGADRGDRDRARGPPAPYAEALAGVVAA